jgi:hypothetical protein
MTNGQSTSLSWCQAPICTPKTRFLLLSDSCRFVDMGCPLWQEDRSVVYNCHWPSPVQSYLPPMNSSSFSASWVLIQFLWRSIFCLFLTRPHLAVMIYWNIVVTTLNMSFRDELFALEAWTDWLGICFWFCLKGGGAHISLTVPVRPPQLRVAEAAAVVVCCCIAPLQRRVLGWCGWKRMPFPL